MTLENLMYEMQSDSRFFGEIYTSGLEMYTGIGGFRPQRGPSSIGGGGSLRAPSAPRVGPSHLSLSGTGSSFKIFGEPHSAPIVRLDLVPHHNKPEKHLQYGSGLYTGRHGKEAADIIGEIIKSNPYIDFFEKEKKKNKLW